MRRSDAISGAPSTVRSARVGCMRRSAPRVMDTARRVARRMTCRVDAEDDVVMRSLRDFTVDRWAMRPAGNARGMRAI